MLQHVTSELKEGGQIAQMQEVWGTCSMHFDIEIGIRIGTTWQLKAFKSLIMGIVHVCNIYLRAYLHIHSYNILSSILSSEIKTSF